MRILFYYTHKQTLGHTTRSIALVTALCRLKAQVLILQGGVPQSFIRFPKNCKVLDVPHPFDSRGSFESHANPSGSAKRAQFILKAAQDFGPDVLITEFFPFGRLSYISELLPLLRNLRQKGKRIIASIGYPLLSDLDRLKDPQFAALHRAIFAIYDHFLIHTPPGLEDPYIQATLKTDLLKRAYAAIMKNVKEKTIYTGYIIPEKMMTGGASLPVFKKDPATILVSRGGGAVYPKLISIAIEAQRLIDDKINTVIACGPATTAEEMNLFKSLLKPEDQDRVFLAEHLDDLDSLLRTCQVSVSLCGYNTSVQMMRYGTPSVLIPYQNTLSQTPNDQLARCRLLAKQFSSIVLDYNTMTPKSLADAIKKQMSSPRPAPAPKDWFNGANLTARFICLTTCHSRESGNLLN